MATSLEEAARDLRDELRGFSSAFSCAFPLLFLAFLLALSQLVVSLAFTFLIGAKFLACLTADAYFEAGWGASVDTDFFMSFLALALDLSLGAKTSAALTSSLGTKKFSIVPFLTGSSLLVFGAQSSFYRLTSLPSCSSLT